MEAFYEVLGCIAMYSWIHFIYLSFSVVFKERTAYEKAITFFAITFFALILIGIIAE